MVKIVKMFLSVLMWLWSKIYTYRLSELRRGAINVFYTFWIKNFLGEMGNESSIQYPCSLQGGGSMRIHIGHHTHIQSHVILGCWEQYNAVEDNGWACVQQFEPEIIIGNYCSIGEYTHITSINKITIGDGLLTGRYVFIGDNSHGGLSINEAEIPPIMRKMKSKGEIMIGRNVWIGDKVTILGGVTVGDNSIIGAGTVVTDDVAPNSIVVGGKIREVKSL